MKQKTTLILFLALIVGMSFSSCKDWKLSGITSGNDSLAFENQRLNEFISIISYTLDSINGQERSLYVGSDGQPLTNKEQIIKNIRDFQRSIKEQLSRIDILEKQLASNSDERSEKLQAVIKSLQKQLEEKDALIARLSSELEKKDADISDLRAMVSNLETHVDELSQSNAQKDVTIQKVTREAEDLSYGYFVMGTKKQLASLGVTTGGFLKKRKADMNNVDNSKYQRVDVRTSTRFDIPGTKVKLMTTHPQGSYSITETGGSSVLTINNPASFWGTSRYLVVQYK